MHFLIVNWIFYAHFSLQVYGQMVQKHYSFLSSVSHNSSIKKKQTTHEDKSQSYVSIKFH